MKTILAGVLAVAFAASVSGVVLADDKVTICHFPGHEAVKGGDFEVPGGPKGEAKCNILGGNVISVGINAAINGHGVLIKKPGDDGPTK